MGRKDGGGGGRRWLTRNPGGGGGLVPTMPGCAYPKVMDMGHFSA